ncbi:aminotransferase-like domain-containing protein [Flavilitoribacter nigricans]|uniref:GntR family transcriptional regulator n=1 Tax=Flavilitoribacter nigricans (strain ATCC 23147 / DSM 23189 / NBRC 102662 / NCIMB 1420 / SS-2) TaxID=1122177 RepID=A0A2D0NHR7_FLAN2|nr:PLP-dependent aminotransferase family protein [Flavilitoribacter nigricans]PHN07313.1 GntR family transcriptional regulator [Flavilitoribacter nigricans DSM 23189 = NBRC 102662]
MLPWKSLISLDRQSPKSVFLQIAEGVINVIRSGHLQAGERLPGSRQMAQLLDINRKTALLAYDELLAQGWIISRASRGTFVADSLPILQSRSWSGEEFPRRAAGDFSWEIPDYLTQPLAFSYPMAFDDGLPDIRLAPIEELARAYSRNLRNLWDHRRLSYGDALGHPHLREVLARELNNTRGLNITPDHLIITRGSQMAIFLAARVVLSDKQSTVVMTDPGYRTAGLNFRYAGGRILTVPVDEEGLVVTELEKICKRQSIQLVYVTPHHHYPTTVMLSPQRRMELLQLADVYDFAILEDDYDYDFHYGNSPVLPLASGDHQKRVLYIGSFSKNISPAIRMGYLVGPPDLIRELPKIRRLIDRQGDVTMEAAIAELLEEGIIRRYLKKALRQYRQRRDAGCDRLQTELGDYLKFDKPAGGLAIWAKFHPDIDLPALSEVMLRQQVYLSNGKFYAPEENAIRMGFACMSETEMVRAITILKESIQSAFPTFVPGNWKKD